MPADAATDLSALLTRLQPGARLAGCYLLQKAVEGAAWPTWLANDEVLGKDISLQFLPTSVLSKSGAGDRLRQDVKRARQLIHPRILRVYDLVEEEDWAAVAMDTFTTQPLAAVIAGNKGGAFQPQEVWPLVRDLCDTLDEAHRIRVTHGHLSPSDVLVGDGHLKVMNFGVSATLYELAPTKEAAGFLSPQQLSGATPVPADDIYAVGALLHTLLVGAPPFTGSDRPAHPPTISAHRRELRRTGAEVPAIWDEVIASCLATDPAARPKSCGEIAKRLDPATAPAASAAVSSAESQQAAPTAAASAAGAAIAAAAAATPSLESPEAAKASAPIAAEPASAEPLKEAEAGAVSEKPAEEKPSSDGAAEVAAEASAAVASEAAGEAPTPDANAAPAEAADAAKESAGRPGRPERRVRSTGAAAGVMSAADEDRLAETVRREEAAEEARLQAGGTDEEGVDQVSSGGPGAGAILIAIAAIAVIGFFLYRFFFSEPTPSSSSRSTASGTVSTPAPYVPATPNPATPAAKPTATPAVAKATTPSVEVSGSTAAARPEMAAGSTPAPTTTDSHPQPAGADADPKELEAAVTQLTKEIEQAGAELPPAKKALEEIAAEQKKLEDALGKAEREAQEAEKLAADKKKAADDAKKAAFSTAEEVAGKKTQLAKSEEKLSKLQAALQQKQHALAAVKKAGTTAPAAMTTAASPTPAKRNEVVPLKPTATTLPQVDSAAAGNDARSAFEQKMKELGSVLGSKATPSVKVGASPSPKTELAKATTPKPGEAAAPTDEAGKKAGAAASDTGFTNSLGMKMLPIPGGEGLICIWPTRVRDFEAFAKSANLKSALWKDPGFKQSPDHPVVNVSWQEAMGFCKWLTAKEQKEGLISAKQSYRLPTDLEWSRAAGLNNEKGATPESRDMGVSDVYPWGTGWPPPSGAGNYTGEETGSDVAIKGYNDGFPWTSPVGSFPPNKYGLYDMGGNVWQWCMDGWNADSKAKVLRGASWYNGALKLSLLTSCRVHASPDSSTDNYGFRIVLSGDSSNTTKR